MSSEIKGNEVIEDELVEFQLDYEQTKSDRPNVNGALLYKLFQNNGGPLDFHVRSISGVKRKNYNGKISTVVYVNLVPNETYKSKVFDFDEEGTKKTFTSDLGTEEPVLIDGEVSYFLDQIKFTRNNDDDLDDLDLSLKNLVLHQSNVGYYLAEALFIESGDIQYGKVKSNVIKFTKEFLDSNQEMDLELSVVKRQNTAGYKDSIMLVHPKRYDDLIQLKNYS